MGLEEKETMLWRMRISWLPLHRSLGSRWEKMIMLEKDVRLGRLQWCRWFGHLDSTETRICIGCVSVAALADHVHQRQGKPI